LELILGTVEGGGCREEVYGMEEIAQEIRAVRKAWGR
jgi:hypothetical protein